MPIITNPTYVIENLIHKEIQHDTDDPIEIALDGYGDSYWDNDDISLAFTVHDKQINSKKLIEGITSNCRLMVYVKDNKFHFKGIPANPDPRLKSEFPAAGQAKMYINHKDIISYTNKRTAPEKVYTEVKINYHYDYALKSFMKNTIDYNSNPDSATEYFESIDGGDPHGSGIAHDDDAPLYNIINLGLKKPQELSFDAHYLRDDNSAQALQEFLLLWHCNQHNIMNIKLPLKYIQLQIGDYIGFDKMINEVKLFGEDYSIDNFNNNIKVFRNGQQILPLWMIISSKKTLTHIDLEVMQMHNCSLTPMSFVDYPPFLPIFDIILNSDNYNYYSGTNYIVLNESSSYVDVNFRVQGHDFLNTELKYHFLMMGESAPKVYNYINGVENEIGEIGADDISNYLEFNWDNHPPFYNMETEEYVLGEGSSGAEITIVGSDDTDNPGSPRLKGYPGKRSWLFAEHDPGGDGIGGFMNNPNFPNGSYVKVEAGRYRCRAQEIDTPNEQYSNARPSKEFRIYKNNMGEAVTITIDYIYEWNLISIPVDVIPNNNIETVFPDESMYVTGSMYGFGITYAPETVFVPGVGYWLRFPDPVSHTILGNPINQLTIELNLGWNLIGGLTEQFQFFDGQELTSGVSGDTDIIIPGTLYGFDGTMFPTLTLEPGKGYWIKCSEAGQIILTS